MWEYAVLHPPNDLNGRKYCIVHAKSTGEKTTYVSIECNKKITLQVGAKFARSITQIEGKKCKYEFSIFMNIASGY